MADGDAGDAHEELEVQLGRLAGAGDGVGECCLCGAVVDPAPPMYGLRGWVAEGTPRPVHPLCAGCARAVAGLTGAGGRTIRFAAWEEDEAWRDLVRAVRRGAPADALDRAAVLAPPDEDPP